MKKLFVLLIVALMVSVFSVDSHAELYDRGCGLIYDDFSDITWLQDANYAASLVPLPPGVWGGGYQSWQNAVDWADGLEYPDTCRNKLWTDWRLPTAYNEGTTTTCIGYDCTHSEMGNLYYTELGNLAGYEVGGGLQNTCFTDHVTGHLVCFENLTPHRYWLGEPLAAHYPRGPFWEFNFYVGWQGLADCHIAWPVRNGDVGQYIGLDIQPESDSNNINLSSNGVTPVALLSSSTFDANTIDPETVNVGGASVKKVGKKDKYLCHEDDVNGDELSDLVCNVNTAEFTQTSTVVLKTNATTEPGEFVVVLEAATFDGTTIYGEDTILTTN